MSHVKFLLVVSGPGIGGGGGGGVGSLQEASSVARQKRKSREALHPTGVGAEDGAGISPPGCGILMENIMRGMNKFRRIRTFMRRFRYDIL